MRRWEFRRPILGRLVWGWVVFAVMTVSGVGWLALEQMKKPKIARVALNMDAELTKLAPPPQSLHFEPPRDAVNVTAKTTPTLIDSNNTDHANTDNPNAENRGALRYSQTSLDAITLNTEHPSTDRPNTPSNNAPRTYKVTSTPAHFAENNEPPGELVITIDGRNIDEHPPAHNATRSSALTTKPALPIRVLEPQLVQSGQYGDIPRITPDGRRAALYYAFRGRNKPTEKSIALIVTGLGLNAELTRQAIEELPPQITLSFAPYTENLNSWAEKARQKGHEILIELPMEGYGGDAARQLGPAGLLTSHSSVSNLKRLDWILSRTSGYFGVTNYLGGKFSADGNAINPVIKRINDLGLAYIDDTGAAPSPTSFAAGDIAHIITPVSDDGNKKEMQTDLNALKQKAIEKEFALGKIAASEIGLDIINAFLTGLDDDGINLAPASAVLYVGNSH